MTVHILAPLHTLVENLTIMHHAAEGGDAAEPTRLSRHYYEIWCLLNGPDTVAQSADRPLMNWRVMLARSPEPSDSI